MGILSSLYSFYSNLLFFCTATSLPLPPPSLQLLANQITICLFFSSPPLLEGWQIKKDISLSSTTEPWKSSSFRKQPTSSRLSEVLTCWACGNQPIFHNRIWFTGSSGFDSVHAVVTMFSRCIETTGFPYRTKPLAPPVSGSTGWTGQSGPIFKTLLITLMNTPNRFMVGLPLCANKWPFKIELKSS